MNEQSSFSFRDDFNLSKTFDQLVPQNELREKTIFDQYDAAEVKKMFENNSTTSSQKNVMDPDDFLGSSAIRGTKVQDKSNVFPTLSNFCIQVSV